jgi:mono/diheme cytochrome c family protein
MNSNLRFNPLFVNAVIAVLALSHGALVQAQAPAQSQSRGEMLYSTHCIACHTTEIHWRDKSLVTDWNTLKVQVKRWQGVAMLGWSEADILEVARYLNQIHYRLEPATIPIASAGPLRVQ